MIKLDDNTKKLCKKFLGADGKFIINDSTPADLIDLFQYFNDNDIDVLTLELNDVALSEDEEELIFDEDDSFDSDDNEVLNNNIDSNIAIGKKLEQSKLNDLDNFF